MLFIPYETQQDDANTEVNNEEKNEDKGEYFSLDNYEEQQERIISRLLVEFYTRLDGEEGKRVASQSSKGVAESPVASSRKENLEAPVAGTELSAETFVYNPYRPPKGAKYKEVLTQLNIREWAKARHALPPEGQDNAPNFLHVESLEEHQRTKNKQSNDGNTVKSSPPVDEAMVESIFAKLLVAASVSSPTPDKTVTEVTAKSPQPMVSTSTFDQTFENKNKVYHVAQPPNFLQTGSSSAPPIDPLKLLISSHQFGNNYRYGGGVHMDTEDTNTQKNVVVDHPNGGFGGVPLNLHGQDEVPAWSRRNPWQSEGLFLSKQSKSVADVGKIGGSSSATKNSNHQVESEQGLGLQGVSLKGRDPQKLEEHTSEIKKAPRRISFEKKVQNVIFKRALATHDPYKVSELLGGVSGPAPLPSQLPLVRGGTFSTKIPKNEVNPGLGLKVGNTASQAISQPVNEVHRNKKTPNQPPTGHHHPTAHFQRNPPPIIDALRSKATLTDFELPPIIVGSPASISSKCGLKKNTKDNYLLIPKSAPSLTGSRGGMNDERQHTTLEVQTARDAKPLSPLKQSQKQIRDEQARPSTMPQRATLPPIGKWNPSSNPNENISMVNGPKEETVTKSKNKEKKDSHARQTKGKKGKTKRKGV